MPQQDTTRFLLIAREQVKPGSEAAYNENELQLAGICAALSCPHPYLALVSVTQPNEVWWLNAFLSVEERDSLDEAYASNEPLMAALTPLGKRKEEFRESFTSTMTTYRPDLSSGGPLRIPGSRYLIIRTGIEQEHSFGSVFESLDGEIFAITSATNRAAAEVIARQAGSEATILEVQPQWSCPAENWIAADRTFWNSSTANAFSNQAPLHD